MESSLSVPLKRDSGGGVICFEILVFSDNSSIANIIMALDS